MKTLIITFTLIVLSITSSFASYSQRLIAKQWCLVDNKTNTVVVSLERPLFSHHVENNFTYDEVKTALKSTKQRYYFVGDLCF